MTKLRGLVLAGLIGLLAVCAPPAQAVVVLSPAALSAAAAPAPAPVLLLSGLQEAVPPGPVIDPNDTTQANAAKSKNKLIAGGVAVVLLLLVIVGRRQRAKKRKKNSDQAQGK
jgi:hypothetical protein